MTDREAVADWIECYLRAWDSNDPGDIEDLFAHDGSYRFHPWDDPVTGHDAIVAAWLRGRDDVGDHAFSWQIVAVEGDVAVIQGRTRYTAGMSAGRVWENLWVLHLNAERRATSFTEWYMERERDPEGAAEPAG